jgi:hypothetical protein
VFHARRWWWSYLEFEQVITALYLGLAELGTRCDSIELYNTTQSKWKYTVPVTFNAQTVCHIRQTLAN